MSINANQIPTSDKFEGDYAVLRNLSSSVHQRISADLYNASGLYKQASALEDVVLEDFLSIYTEAIGIDFTSRNMNTVTESFLTTGYSDPAFPVQKRLNIDTLNGDLVLPLLESTNLQVSSVIIEADSNGSVGDLVANDNSGDANAILKGSDSSLFKYNKLVTAQDSEDLVLSLSFALKNQEILNAIYIELFTTNNGVYPTVDLVEISTDGIEWKAIDVSYDLNKSDYYLRFYPVTTQYIRIRFSQASFNAIKTLFGYKYQHLIGIRQVSFKQDMYDYAGEYVSIPFSTGKTINSVTFTHDGMSNNDVKYMISANGGGKWLNVSNNQSVDMIAENIGTLATTDITSVRVKIAMDKTVSKLNNILGSEFAAYNKSNQYYLKKSPTSIYVSYGKHISFGGEYSYTYQITDSSIERLVLLGIPFYIASSKDINGSPMLVVKSNGSTISSSEYTIEQDTNTQNSVLIFSGSVTGNSSVNITLKPYLYQSQLQNKIDLPVKSHYDNKYEFYITKYIGSVSITGGEILPFEAYNVESSIELETTTITIQNSYFIRNAIYEIKYVPSFRISNSLDISTNQISIPSLNLYNNSELRFDYVYADLFDVNLVKYYTPITHKYSVEIL